MHQWAWSAYIGIFSGLALFALILTPVLIYQYRKYGGVRFLRFLGSAAVSIYSVTVIAYTLLPLPSPNDLNCPASPEMLQTRPGASLNDIAEVVAQSGLSASLTSPVILQVVFNVLLFVPLGLALRGYFERSFLTTVLAGLVTSVAIETTQYTGLWGLYECAYRVADIDDIITNTLGTLIGAALAPLLLAFMPRKRALSAGRLVAKPVTKPRRLVAVLIDFFLYSATSFTLLAALSVGGKLLKGTDWNPSKTLELGLTVGVGVVLVAIPALVGSGASLGQRAVWLQPTWKSGRRLKAVLRMLCGFGGYVILDVLSTYGPAALREYMSLGSLAFVLISAGSLLLLKDPRGLSFRLTGAQLVDSRKRLTR